MEFLKGFFKHPRAVGAVLPSSVHLANELLRHVDWKTTRALAEIGPGTGPITQSILQQRQKTTVFFAVELDRQFVKLLQSRFPQADIVHADAHELRHLCDSRQIDHLDALISGLPWAAFPSKLQLNLLAAVLDSLGPKGRFSTFAYIHGLWLPAGIRFRGLLKEHFDSVEISPIVWKNAPPAIVYHCQKK
jgi:phospholipid N-methyltransferase